MIIPIRCFSCGKPVGQLYEEFNEKVESGQEVVKVLDDLGIKRYCCRGVLMGHVDLIDVSAGFKRA